MSTKRVWDVKMFNVLLAISYMADRETRYPFISPSQIETFSRNLIELNEQSTKPEIPQFRAYSRAIQSLIIATMGLYLHTVIKAYLRDNHPSRLVENLEKLAQYYEHSYETETSVVIPLLKEEVILRDFLDHLVRAFGASFSMDQLQYVRFDISDVKRFNSEKLKQLSAHFFISPVLKALFAALVDWMLETKRLEESDETRGSKKYI